MTIKPLLIVLTGILSFSSLTFAQNADYQKFNLNFDKVDPENPTMPEGWMKWGFFKNVSVEKHSVKNYMGKVVSDNNGKFGSIAYRIPANYIGDTIRLTGKIKHESVKGYVGLLMRIDGINTDKSLIMENMAQYKINGTNDWKEYSIQFPYPDGAEFINVGGILSGTGTAWFDDFQITIDGKDIQKLKTTAKAYLKDINPNELISALAKSSKPLNFSQSDSLFSTLDPLIELLGDKKIVAIGENTHGTSEYYQLREIITKRLIQEKGFDLVILENPYDEIELLNRDLENFELDDLIKKHLFPIYQTEEMRSFLQWYKANYLRYNLKFKGCDDSYWSFYGLLESSLGGIKDKKLKELLLELKSNIDESSTDNLKKANKINTSLYNNILDIENHLKNTNNLTSAVEEILFNGKNTHLNYLNIENKKPIQSRDEIMADRVSFFANNTDHKIIVWAHNAHISNEVITNNEIGIMGRDLKKDFGVNYHSIGLTTLEGSYSYIEEKFINGDNIYSDKLEKAKIQPTASPYWESALALNGSAFYLNMSDLREELQTDEIIGPTKLIGYNVETARDIYHLPLLKLFDSIIFIENTTATTPLD